MNISITQSQRRITLAMVLLNAFTTPLMLSAANVALPHIAEDLSLDAISISWIPMAYLMASAMFLFLFGRMADVFGRKRLFLFGTLFVIISSLLAAMSTNATQILSARFFQGASSAMLYATQVAIVTSIYPPSKRGQMVGLTVSMIYLGLCCGPLLGGVCIDTFGWRSAFILHVPLALIVLLIGHFKVTGEWLAEGETHVDFIGAGIYAIFIVCLCVAVTQLPSFSGYLLILFSLIALVGFIKLQVTQSSPLLDVKLMFNNKIFRYSCMASLLVYTATFANVVLISLYLQYLKGLSATAAGVVMMIQPLTMAIFSPVAGKLSDHLQPRLVSSIGMLVTMAGLLLLSQLTTNTSIVWVVFALFLTGLGFGFFSSPNVNAMMGSVEKRLYGSANAVVAMMRIVGQLSSMMLVAMVFSMSLGDVEITREYFPQLETAIRYCFIIASVLCVPGVWFSYFRGQLKWRH